MGMLLRRHYATAEPVKPVEQIETVATEEMPKVEYEQVAITELVEEPEKEPKTKTVRHTTKRTTSRTAKRK